MLEWLNELWDDTFKDIVELLLEAMVKLEKQFKSLCTNFNLLRRCCFLLNHLGLLRICKL